MILGLADPPWRAGQLYLLRDPKRQAGDGSHEQQADGKSAPDTVMGDQAYSSGANRALRRPEDQSRHPRAQGPRRGWRRRRRAGGIPERHPLARPAGVGAATSVTQSIDPIENVLVVGSCPAALRSGSARRDAERCAALRAVMRATLRSAPG